MSPGWAKSSTASSRWRRAKCRTLSSALFLPTAMANMALHSADGSIHYHFMDWRHIRVLIEAALERVRGNTRTSASGTRPTPAWAASIARSTSSWGCSRKAARRTSTTWSSAGHGRYRTNVWTYAGETASAATRDADLADHPTVKPVGARRRRASATAPSAAAWCSTPSVGLRHHHPGCRAHRPAGRGHRDRPALRRHRHPPLAGADGQGCGPG